MPSSTGVDTSIQDLSATNNRPMLLTRTELLFLAFAVTVVNALVPSATGAVAEFGWVGAIMATFKVSVIVWAAIWMGLEFTTNGDEAELKPLDIWMVGCSLFACFLPIGGATWLVLTGLALYVIVTSTNNSDLRRAGWIFLAITFPMFWGRRLFNLFSDYILTIDAIFVSLVTQTERVGNTVEMPGAAGTLLIGAPCSSMANMSLAVLCWTLFTQHHQIRWTFRNVFWCLLACVSVMLINVARIAIIGFFPHYYAFLHDGAGVVVFSWLSAIMSVVVCHVGVRYGGLKKS